MFCRKKKLIARIKEMEERFDRLSQAAQANELTDANNEDYEALKKYMDSGQWLKDFKADEKGKLPAGLKRGVLSEDGLYNLLEEVAGQTGNDA